MDENVRISTNISFKFAHNALINNIPALVQIMAWRRPGDKPVFEPMMVDLLTHICVTRPQWVNTVIRDIYPWDVLRVYSCTGNQWTNHSVLFTPVWWNKCSMKYPALCRNWKNYIPCFILVVRGPDISWSSTTRVNYPATQHLTPLPILRSCLCFKVILHCFFDTANVHCCLFSVKGLLWCS